MYYELTWLGAALLGVGAVALGVSAARLILRAVRDRDIANDGRDSRRRRLGPETDRS
jgi:hypothetical protein